jgi:anti-anti-sigma factor
MDAMETARNKGERSAPMEINGTFRVEQIDDTMIVTPMIDLGEFEYARIDRDGREILERLAAADARNVVVDCSEMTYYGSAALGFFVRVWKRLRMLGGHMAFCNISPDERHILKVTRLDTLWGVCGSREEALEAVLGEDVSS